MILLAILVTVTLAARAAGAWRKNALDSWAAATRAGLAALFLFTGVAHFGPVGRVMQRMVPAWAGDPAFVVAITGVFEILGAIGLLLPRTRRAAAVALILFLVAVFPANVKAAMEGLVLGGSPATPIAPRAAMQLLLIGLVGWSGIRRGGKGERT